MLCALTLTIPICLFYSPQHSYLLKHSNAKKKKIELSCPLCEVYMRAQIDNVYIEANL